MPLTLLRSSLDRRETAWLAWFGPLGVAAIYDAIFVERFDVPEYERVFAAATLAVCASVVVHAVTATPAVRRLAPRRVSTVLLHPLREGVEEDP